MKYLKILAIPIIILVIIALSVFGGKSFADESKQIPTNINALMNDLYSGYLGETEYIKQGELTKGFFSSTTEYHLVDDAIIIEAHAQHNPLTVITGNKYKVIYKLKRNEDNDLLFKSFEGKEPILVTQKEGFLGGRTFDIDIPQNLTSADGIQIDFSGSKITIKTDKKYSKLTSKGTMKKFSYNDVKRNFSINDVLLDIKIQQSKLGNYYIVDNSNIKIKDIIFTEKDETKDITFQINKIDMSSEETEKNKLYAMQSKLNIAQIKIGQEVANEDLGSITSSTSIKNIDRVAFENIRTNTNAEENLQIVLANKPEFNINSLIWETPKGKSTLEFAIIGKQLNGEKDFYHFIDRLNLKINLSENMWLDLAEKLLRFSDQENTQEIAKEQWNEFKTSPQMAMLFKVKDGDLTTDITMENNILNINGKKMTPDELQEKLSQPFDDN